MIKSNDKLYNFSIIIPHKNIPELLQRCLDSIPFREDLQVIVIDDNSDNSIVDFSNFPGVNIKNTSIFYSKGRSGKGPGYARNLGLENATGKWVIFADADDYFSEGLSELLDEYLEAKEDIVFFKCTSENEYGMVSINYTLINDAIDAAINGDTDSIVYGVPCPWGKFIKREFLQKNNIKYQEITGGDDILFSIRMAIKVKTFFLSEESLYCVVDRSGSLTRNTRWQGFYSYVLACLEAYTLLLNVSKEKLAKSWTSSWWGFLWAENKFIALLLVPKILWVMGFRTGMNCVKVGIKRGAWNWRKK